MKTCNRCDIAKEDSEFNKKGNGLHPTCKVCRAIERQSPITRAKQRVYQARYYAQNRERELERHKQWYLVNRDRIKRERLLV